MVVKGSNFKNSASVLFDETRVIAQVREEERAGRQHARKCGTWPDA